MEYEVICYYVLNSYSSNTISFPFFKIITEAMENGGAMAWLQEILIWTGLRLIKELYLIVSVQSVDFKCFSELVEFTDF